jgi:hypothetical protein
MGSLNERVKLNQLVYGGDLVSFYKENTLFMYDKYSKSDDMCEAISISDIFTGRFYFLHYHDSSNWMRYSPIFCVDYRKFDDKVVILGLNFNFIPLEIRSAIFDKFISEQDFDNNSDLKVDFKGVYTELMRYGFEYTVVEYNAAQIQLVHRIHLELLPRFLYSSHPKNKYDPNKLVEIWTAKLKNREKRHQEMTLAILSDFYDINNEISEKYDALKKHIQRVQNSLNKFKNK